MSGTFLSYRRDDASGWAGRLYEHLVREWGPDEVFIDVDAIAPGEDFRKAIASTLDRSDTVLVVIGSNWLTARDEAGNRRLDDEADTHRAEVVAALEADVRVIPVLVGGAPMPAGSDLPAPLVELAYRNAAVIDDRRFANDARGLMDSVTAGRDKATGWASPDPAVASHGGAPSRRATPATAHRPARTPRSLDAGRATPAPQASFPAPALALTLGGSLLVLVWGVLIRPAWHDELWGVRLGAAMLLVGVAAVGLWWRRWKLVLGAGLTGLIGLVLWMLVLLFTEHTTSELLSPATDGTTNMLMLIGAVAVVAGAVVGERASSAFP